MAMAKPALGMSGTKISITLDGRWVKTMVFRRPMRRARGGAARKESALPILTPKKIAPKAVISTP